MARQSLPTVPQLDIVFDSWSEGHAIYVEGKLRGEWSDGELTPEELFECYTTYARGPVRISRYEVDTKELGIYEDPFGPDWPDQIAALNIPF